MMKLLDVVLEESVIPRKKSISEKRSFSLGNIFYTVFRRFCIPIIFSDRWHASPTISVGLKRQPRPPWSGSAAPPASPPLPLPPEVTWAEEWPLARRARGPTPRPSPCPRGPCPGLFKTPSPEEKSWLSMLTRSMKIWYDKSERCQTLSILPPPVLICKVTRTTTYLI